MSGRLHHHPLDQTIDQDVDHDAMSGHPTNPPAHSSGTDSDSAATPWTAGLSVESAADIAAREGEDARFSRASEHWAGDAPTAAASEQPASPWATSQLVRDNEVPAEKPNTEAAVDTEPTDEAAEPPAEATTEAGMDAGTTPVDESADTSGPGARVNFAVWVDNDLRRRLRAAHTYTGDDEGYDTLSDYVSTVLQRDVERIERTYNEGVAFPAEDEEPSTTGESYEVRARYGEGLWELRIGDAGVTLSPTLAGAETMARTYLSLLKDVPADTIAVTVIPELEGELSGEIVRSRRRTARAEEAISRAEEMLTAARDELGQVRDDRRQLLRRLSEHGLSAADVDTIMAITPDA